MIKTIIISGGGTAGHLNPAITIGERLKGKAPDLHLVFVGSGRAVEKNIMANHKADYIPLKIEGIKGKGIKIIKSLGILPYGFIKSLAILLKIRPKLVIGMGGYSSGPIVLLASWMRIPTMIMEQNVKPGFTNRLLIPWIKKAIVSFKDSLAYFKGKGILIGNPVREEFFHLKPKERDSRLSILISGGSQGSHFLNEGIIEALPILRKEKDKLVIFHQTGEKDFKWVKDEYDKAGFNRATIKPFFIDMASCFEKVDLIICRAGATTIAELIAARKASLLIPFSQATDNHQVLNAEELEKIQGAELLLEEDFSSEILAQKILNFLLSREDINRMERNLSQMKRENVADRIADICFDLMEKS